MMILVRRSSTHRTRLGGCWAPWWWQAEGVAQVAGAARVRGYAGTREVVSSKIPN